MSAPPAQPTARKTALHAAVAGAGLALALREGYFTFFTFSQRPVFADFSTESVT